MADVVEINELEELEQHRLTWNRLLPDTPRASFFHTIDWLAQFWRHFGGARKFRILVVRASGAPIGIVPLCVQTESYHVGSVRVLTFPLSDWGMWYGPIGANPSASMFMAMQHLRRTQRDWDVMELRWLDAARSDPSGAGRAMRAAGMTPQKKDYQVSSQVKIEGSWSEYLASRSSKWRHELRRQFRVLEKLGNVEFVRHRPESAACGDGEPRWDLYEECQQIASRSWQGSSTTGNTLSHNGVREFLRDCHETAARLGMLDIALLRVDGRPAAFSYNYIYDRDLYGLRIGYDPNIPHKGLGKSLLGYVLRDGHERGDRSYDLGPGDYDFKRRFRTGTANTCQYTYFPPLAVKSQSLRLSRWLKSRLVRDAIPTKPHPESA